MITLVYPYYNNGGMLERQLSVWRTYQQPESWSLVLVDDGSQEDPASSHLMPCGIDVTLYRITTDIAWNQHGAKNLAMSHCTGWCLLSDIDHVLPAEEAEHLQALLPTLDPKRVYRFARVSSQGETLTPIRIRGCCRLTLTGGLAATTKPSPATTAPIAPSVPRCSANWGHRFCCRWL